jgi:hypothetical protein
MFRDGTRIEGKGGMIWRAGCSDDVIEADFVSPPDRKPSLIPSQIHASLSLPKIEGKTTEAEIGHFPSALISVALLGCKVISRKQKAQ